jgi:hypothetical protein
MATFPTQFKIGGSTGAVNAVGTRLDGYQAIQFDTSLWVAAGYVKTDVATLLTIPARTKFVLEAVYSDNTVSWGTTPTFSLGDSGSATLYINAQTPGASGASIATMATTSKIYDAASAITVTLNNASGTVTSGKFTIVYRLTDLSAAPVAQAAISV